MDEKNKQLECPFTWALEKEWVCNFDEMDEPDVEFDEEPLLALICSIMISYFRAEKKDYAGAFANIKITDEIWEKVDKSQLEIMGVSEKVLLHIKVSTEYFIHDLAQCKVKANRLLKSLENSESFQSSDEIATINGCKSVAWSSFHEKAHEKTIKFAKLAVSKNSKCPLWYYILGKGLRHSRREIENWISSDEEEDTILKACELSNTPFYKIRLAQVYREKKDYSKSKEIYLELFSENPKSSLTLLRLAMGFMSECKDFDRAKKCLDEAGRYKQNFMYHHYFGVFYTKQKDFWKAVEHFEKADILANTFKSALQYANAQQKIDKNFNYVRQLETMLVKYNTKPRYKQQLLLHIGMQHYFNTMDTGKSLYYFLQAIDVDPENQQLMKYFNVTMDWKCYNIYDFVRKVQKGYDLNHKESSDLNSNDLKKLENYCKQYEKVQLLK